MDYDSTDELEPTIAPDRFATGFMPTERFHANHAANLEEMPLPETAGGQVPGQIALVSTGAELGAVYEWTEPRGPNYHRVIADGPSPSMVVRPR